MRTLKHHEAKLLKKVNLFKWKSENEHRENRVLMKYRVQNRDDYSKYAHAGRVMRKRHATCPLSCRACFTYTNT